MRERGARPIGAYQAKETLYGVPFLSKLTYFRQHMISFVFCIALIMQ